MNKTRLPKAVLPGLIFCASLSLLTSGCDVYVRGPRADVYVAPPAQVFIASDDYVYYPQYGMYFGSRSHLFYYQNGGAWASGPGPRGVSVDVVLRSPSVRMDFHDSPAAHHAQIVKAYPHNYKPGANHGGKEDEDKR